MDILMEKQKQLQALQAEIEALEKAKEDEMYAKNTQAFLDTIYDINVINSMHETLHSNTKTVPIIDRFYNSRIYNYLILPRFYYPRLYETSCSLDLVIRKIDRKIKYKTSAITISYLKQEYRKYIRDGDFLTRYEGEKGYPLIKAILDIPQEDITRDITDPKTNRAIPFKTPIKFNAQTSQNRTGYGSEYNNGELVYQGTLYGETTQFAIIGVILNHS